MTTTYVGKAEPVIGDDSVLLSREIISQKVGFQQTDHEFLQFVKNEFTVEVRQWRNAQYGKGGWVNPDVKPFTMTEAEARALRDWLDTFII